jgi:hypothetical protein
MTAAPMSGALLQGLDGPAVERQVAADIVRRGLMVTPVLLAVTGAIWGVHGAVSAAYAMVLVLANFTLAALLMSWAARVSLVALAVAALGGYILRLALLTVAVYAVSNQSWVSWVPLALTIGITHLGLLAWETRYISATLAFPGLKPHTPKGA